MGQKILKQKNQFSRQITVQAQESKLSVDGGL